MPYFSLCLEDSKLKNSAQRVDVACIFSLLQCGTVERIASQKNCLGTQMMSMLLIGLPMESELVLEAKTKLCDCEYLNIL